MKKILFAGIILCGMTMASHAQTVGQDIKEGVKTGAHAVKKGAKKVAHKTAELASKGKAHITDQKYKDKVGPRGEVIYIDKHDKYYWIDKKGHKHYIMANKLKNAPAQ
ncbi:MAG: hypothetical protein C4329_07845 [Chitinophagaceae bacterium]